MSYWRKRKNHYKVEDIVYAISNNGLRDNHSVAYCLVGYICAYLRYYHPIEFLTSFLNNAANEDDIRRGTEYASKLGIKVTMPKWAFSKSNYSYSLEDRIIAKGLSSVKYMGKGIAEELYDVAHSGATYDYFVDVLSDVFGKTSIDARQIEILIKLDFFSDFGNQRELLRIYDIFSKLFKKGEAKKLKRDGIDGTPMQEIISKYSNSKNKNGSESKSYTLLDTKSAMRELELSVLKLHMDDLDNKVKIENFKEFMGYYGYFSGKEEDRKKLYIVNVFPLYRKKDGKQFGYSIITRSIGSGKEARFTVFNKVFDSEPVKQGDIIYCERYRREGQYFTMESYYRDW